MEVPELVFQLFDDNNQVDNVNPDKDHIFSGDFDDYNLPKSGDIQKSLSNATNVDKEIDGNISPNSAEVFDVVPVNDIVDFVQVNVEEDPLAICSPNIGEIRDTNDNNEEMDNICSISSLQSPLYDAAPPENNIYQLDELTYKETNFRFPDDNLRHGLPSITDIQDIDCEVDDHMSVPLNNILSDPSITVDCSRPLEPAITLQSPEDANNEGLWFKNINPTLPRFDDEDDKDLNKQCDKILTYESEFALPKVCEPLVEKDRLSRSFGERDFRRHRKDQATSLTSFNAFNKKHHKSHKHKHSRKDKVDSGKDENKDTLTAAADQPKRPRSATFNNTSAVLAMTALQAINEKNVDLILSSEETGGIMKRSTSLQDTKTVDDKLKESENKDSRRSQQKRHHRHHHKRHHHARHLKNKGLNAQDTLELRIRSGMHALEEERKALREIVDEIGENFGEKDREDINSHRFGDMHRSYEPTNLRPRRHHRSGMLTHVSDFDTVSVCSFLPTKPHMQIEMEETQPSQTQLKSPSTTHKESGFVELEELTVTENNALQWKERARWIKFEEDVEKNERWGKPHVASLSFQSLLELRKGLETGTVLLNLDNYDLPTIFESIVENLIITDQIKSSMREKVKGILLSKHCHHHQSKPGLLKRKPSTASLFSQSTKDNGIDNEEIEQGEEIKNVELINTINDHLMLSKTSNGHTILELKDLTSDSDDGYKKKTEVKFAPIIEEAYGQVDPKTESDVKERIPVGAEATSVLVANIEDLDRTAVAFVRLAKGCLLGNLTEVSIPVRFLFVIMGPPSNHDYFEIGRSIATLMSDKIFHDLAYSAKSRDDILAAINSFLDDSIVLAPGDWDRHLLLPLLQAEISEKRRERIKLLKQQAQWEDPDEENPLGRTGKPFGGLQREFFKKIKFFRSDFKDGFNVRCLISIIFVFFATFAPTITFGALLETKTKGNLGVIETLLATSFSGVMFGMFSGQPLMIIGTTGPILVFEQATYDLSELFGIDFLKWRLWIGLWVMLICWAVVMFEGCFLVEHFTRFTEEVFSVLISLLFIYEAVAFLVKTYKSNPLVDYEKLREESSAFNVSTNTGQTNGTSQSTPSPNIDGCLYNNPNVALISTLLLLGTFYIAYYLRKLRVSHFLSSKSRRVLSDFGVPFAMVFMVALNILSHDVSHVPKLKFKTGLQPTRDDRSGFIVTPMGLDGYWIAVAFLPALCVSILLFMETELTGVLLNKRKNKLKKGGGYNLDLFIMGLLCGLCSVFGLPWMCAATVRSVQHQNALAVMSRSHAPGEKPYLLRIHEQRLTNISIHVLIGVCVLAYPWIEEIPLAVCYGVFLYLGFSSLSGIQFIEQLKLIFVPSKYHPNRKYIRNVPYRSLLWYTMIQVVCLILLVVCKLSPIAPVFPFIIIGMVFLRRFIERYFSEDELEDLDNEDDGDFDEFDEYGVSLPC